MNRSDFTFTATVHGCTIFYKGHVIEQKLVKVRRGPVTKHENSARYFHELAKYQINSIIMGTAQKYCIDSVKRLEKGVAVCTT